MKIIFFAFALFLSSIVSADSLYTGAWSHHIDPAPTVNNESHNLIAYEHSGYIVGRFKNSFSEPTALAAKQFEVFETSEFKGNIYLGATYGYYSCTPPRGKNGSANNHAVACLTVVPEITYTKYSVQPTIIILGNAIALSIKWQL